MKQLLLLNPEKATEEEVKSYRIREAARAVVTDAEGKIALLHVSNENYYKLPGGGLEGTEDRLVALKRECQEEIGCDVEVTEEIGSIVEYRKIFNLKQTSYCYLAKIEGQKREPNFTDSEIEKGFKIVWLTYEEAKRSLTECSPTTFEGSAYIIPRDTAILEEAQIFLTNLKKVNG
jgi:8-oxo-dGTP pyrophosphatase MutT (NUDIX family)